MDGNFRYNKYSIVRINMLIYLFMCAYIIFYFTENLLVLFLTMKYSYRKKNTGTTSWTSATPLMWFTQTWLLPALLGKATGHSSISHSLVNWSSEFLYICIVLCMAIRISIYAAIYFYYCIFFSKHIYTLFHLILTHLFDLLVIYFFSFSILHFQITLVSCKIYFFLI